MSTKTKIISNSFAALRKNAQQVNILYVEDDPLIRQEYFHFLSRFFHDVECRENGQEGLDAAMGKKYDLIISDVEMPKMSGLDMIDKIKQKYPDQVCIIISAHKDSEFLHRCVSLGIDGYIFKPLDRNITIDLLNKVVNNINMSYENKQYKRELEALVEEKTKKLVEVFTTDKVTGVYSFSKLQKELASSSQNSLSILKIRNFKHLNDYYGYHIGNDILSQTAAIIKKLLYKYENNTKCELYRITGAHFAILADEDSKNLAKIVTQIVNDYELSEISIDDELVLLEMDASIVDNRCELSLSNADKALRQSEKERRIVLYKHDDDAQDKIKQRFKCKNAIKRALNENRIVVYYQPIVDNKTQKIHKYEALVRMLHEDGKVISPSLFLPISKETKYYNLITKFVIEKALNDFRDSQCYISINLSMEDINDKMVISFLHEQVNGFPDPSRIVFEILESEEISSYQDLKYFIKNMRRLGCKVAIDDFGSGYSNFEHLVQLDVDYVKIDGSLIKNIHTDFASQAIVEMLSNFALKMGIKTIAEFVSTKEINSFVNKIGIDESQGYYFSKPIPFHKSMNNMCHQNVLLHE